MAGESFRNQSPLLRDLGVLINLGLTGLPSLKVGNCYVRPNASIGQESIIEHLMLDLAKRKPQRLGAVPCT